MSYSNFSKYQIVRVIDDVDTVECGSFTYDANALLQHIRMATFIRGVPTGREKFKIEIHADQGANSLQFSSDWMRLNDATITGDQIGWMRFDFGKHNLKANKQYFAFIKSTNYVRNGNLFYVGFCYDYPVQIYSTGILPMNNSLQMILYGYQNAQRL